MLIVDSLPTNPTDEKTAIIRALLQTGRLPPGIISSLTNPMVSPVSEGCADGLEVEFIFRPS